jgi:hypothetical protein
MKEDNSCFEPRRQQIGIIVNHKAEEIINHGSSRKEFIIYNSSHKGRKVLLDSYESIKSIYISTDAPEVEFSTYRKSRFIQLQTPLKRAKGQ